jgi:hypothetical protein
MHGLLLGSCVLVLGNQLQWNEEVHDVLLQPVYLFLHTWLRGCWMEACPHLVGPEQVEDLRG